MVVTHTMQDKAMRAIIDFYDTYPSHLIDEEFLIYNKICKESEVRHLIDVLCSKELITYDFKYDIKAIRLTPNGKKYFEEKADVTHEKRIENIRYIITTAIAVAALITAIASIILQYR